LGIDDEEGKKYEEKEVPGETGVANEEDIVDVALVVT